MNRICWLRRIAQCLEENKLISSMKLNKSPKTQSLRILTGFSFVKQMLIGDGRFSLGSTSRRVTSDRWQRSGITLCGDAQIIC